MLIYSPQAQISDHFKMYEISNSDTATRYKIDNTPTQEILVAAQALAVNVLEPIRAKFGSFSPTSWYRGEALERKINEQVWRTWCTRKGLPRNEASWKQYFALKSHPRGEAADIKVAGVSNIVLRDWILHNIPTFDQLILEFVKPNSPCTGWVHVSYSRGTNRKQSFSID